MWYSAIMKLRNIFKSKQTIKIEKLHTWNKWLSVVHLLQGLAIILFAKSIAWPVTTAYLTADTVSSKVTGEPVLAQAVRTLFSFNPAYLVAVFFFMSAIAHAIIATKYRKTYETNLKKGINIARWIEYSLSASTMMVAIAMLTGIYDLSSLLMIFVLDALMNMMGLVMEVRNQGAKKIDWLPYWLGCLAGIVPWLVFVIYVVGATVYGSGGIPTFVYFIYASMFIFFSSFALNMYLQYKKVGNWADYLYGERMYMILSLVAKSLLAWQVFFGTLRP